MALSRTLAAGLGLAMAFSALADENLLGYTSGAETLPKDTWEAYLWVTERDDKGNGKYTARDYKAELEYGFTHRLSGSVSLHGLSVDTNGLSIDGYLPGNKSLNLQSSGLQFGFKYNLLSPVKDGLGVSVFVEPAFFWKDPHSGEDKNIYKIETQLLLQKNFLDDTLIWAGNLGMEAALARRSPLSTLPNPDFEWSTKPEAEIELSAKTGLSYRVAPNWFIGAEALYHTEFETEVGQERWSLFAGPSVHYGGKQWWATLTWMPQLRGGGETYPGQPQHLHLIEKTKQEIRFKIGYNF